MGYHMSSISTGKETMHGQIYNFHIYLNSKNKFLTLNMCSFYASLGVHTVSHLKAPVNGKLGC